MTSTLLRSFVKGFVWEFISFLIAIIAIYFVSGNLLVSVEFSFFLTVFKIPIYFIHERIWKKIKWGKYPLKHSWKKR